LVARKRRPVERASLRQTITDRVVAAFLVIVAASGLMSILPASSQQAVARAACQVGSLGLGSCGSASAISEIEQLSPPRCPILDDLDETLPEVRVRNVTTADGLAVQISTARSGDSTVRLGPEDASPPPLLLDAEPRTSRDILPGVSVPASAEWFLPRGQGADTIVAAVRDRHAQWVQRRSSLAALSTTLDRGGHDVPAPTILISRLRLDAPVLPPGLHDSRAARSSPAEDGQKPRADYVSLVPSRPALLQFNRITRESAVIADVKGVVGRAPVTGSVRWTRDATGVITSVLFGIVSADKLAAGETRASGTGIAYVSVPVNSSSEQDLAQAWLSDEGGFTVGLEELLDGKAPRVDDQLTSFLTRAATVTILRYSGIDVEQAATHLRDELIALRRTEPDGTKLVAVGKIAPQLSRETRVVVSDPGCIAP
jgi:hypothetical protein